MPDFSLPAKPPDSPGFPHNPQPLMFDTFNGLNTKPSRPALEDGQCYILDGWVPFGKSNARTLYGIGSPIYTVPTGLAIPFYQFFNISDTPLCAVFLSDGSVQQVNTTTFVVTQIAPPGTIASPYGAIGTGQSGSQYFLFSAPQPNGYWVWDGTVLYTAGSTGPDALITQSGADYATPPTLTAVGGQGSGFAATATIENGTVATITVTNPGSGYDADDAVYLAVGATASNPNFTATSILTIVNGVITACTPALLGAGYTSTAKAIVIGGDGVGAMITPTISGGQVTGYVVTNGGEGYTHSATVLVSDENNPIAVIQMNMMPFGVSGTTIETYTDIVWIGNGQAPTTPPPKSRVVFSSPSSVSDFGTPDGGGSFLSKDSFLRVGYHSLKQTNGFLYLIGDSSINTISGVTTTSANGVATTTFINQNQDPQIGSPWPNTVQVFSRNIVFANSFGVHVSYGGSVAKVSEPLDGIYTSVIGSGPNAASYSPSSAVAVIFGIHVYMLLLPIVDQVSGGVTNKLLMWDGQRWWTASQEINLTFIAGQEINSVMTAFGTDSLSIYPLFQTPSVALTKTIQSKFWDAPGYWFTKTVNRLFGLVNYYNGASGGMTVSIDNNSGTPDDTTVNLIANGFTWANGGVPFTWTNGPNVLSWAAPTGLVVYPPIAVGQSGPLVGITMQTNCADMALVSLGILSEIYSGNI